jgi:hypothetical protein
LPLPLHPQFSRHYLHLLSTLLLQQQPPSSPELCIRTPVVPPPNLPLRPRLNTLPPRRHNRQPLPFYPAKIRVLHSVFERAGTVAE